MVVDLAVEDDGRSPSSLDDRLVAAGQVDDLQADRAQGCFTALVNPLLVRTAMRDGLDDPLGNAWLAQFRKTCKSCNSTHLRRSPFPTNLALTTLLCELLRIYHMLL